MKPLSSISELVVPSLALVLCAIALVAGLFVIPLQDLQQSPPGAYWEKSPVTFAERFP